MDKNRDFLFGIIILSISIFACSIIISFSINNLSYSLSSLKNIRINQTTEKNTMTLDEAADYLHISNESLKYLTDEVSGLEIPCLKRDGQYVYTKSGLDKWLELHHNPDN